ncbi:hypothetical protein COI93_17015 [Bacillus cereus]|uniref:Uncharacterized protein n=1 Tax=Bacillus cereus TaxID=1396 RepID=A0A2B0LT88_BACCE|nr:hypothetical protein COI93_17015 [Bacillus cereus]
MGQKREVTYTKKGPSFFYVYIVENFTEYLFVFLVFLWAFVVKWEYRFFTRRSVLFGTSI